MEMLSPLTVTIFTAMAIYLTGLYLKDDLRYREKIALIAELCAVEPDVMVLRNWADPSLKELERIK